MKTYRDLLNIITTLSDEQLDSEIVLIENNIIVNNSIELVIHNNPLYCFKDTNGEAYVDFEDEIESEEYDCEKLLDKNYPIIKL